MKISIVGFGRFGKTLLRLLDTAGDFDIRLFDTDSAVFTGLEDSNQVSVVSTPEEVYESKVIFYCVPISAFESVIKEHQEHFTDEHLLIDTLSVKKYPSDILRKYISTDSGPAMLLTHPMFGPDSSRDGFAGLKIVMNQFLSNDDQYAFWKDVFSSANLDIVELSPDEHDDLAARSQGVTHFIGRLLEEYGFDGTEIDTAGAEALQQIMEQTCNDTWELFVSLQTYNPYTQKMRQDLEEGFYKLHKKIRPVREEGNAPVYGIQGGKGSFNEEAILHYFKEEGAKGEVIYLYTSDNVLSQLTAGKIDYGLFAVHNSIGGIVDESVKAMADHRFHIVQDVVIPIQHFLMKRKDVDEDDIAAMMAHGQVFKQCRTKLASQYSHIKQMTGEGDLQDTAKAAEALAAGGLPKTTAILGPRRLAELYNLDIIAEHLQDDRVNDTHFLLVQPSL